MRCRQNGQIHSLARVSTWLKSTPSAASTSASRLGSGERSSVPEGVENRPARCFARHWLVLEQRRVRLLSQWGIQDSDGNWMGLVSPPYLRYPVSLESRLHTNESRSFLLPKSVSTSLGSYAVMCGRCNITMRELGNTFQLMRTPSLSSISLHCSFCASWSIS